MIKRTLGQLGPSFISGAALVLCFPTFDYAPLAFVAMAPFLISLCGKEGRSAFMAGLAFGLPYFFGTNYWLYHSMSKYGGLDVVTSCLLVFLLAFVLSIFTGIFATLYSKRIRKTSLPALFVAPLFWVLLEYLRSFIFTGYPYSLMGYTQYANLKFIQIADITGVYGVSLLVVAINGAVADFFIARKRRAEKPLFHLSPTMAGYAALALVVIITLVYGYYRLEENYEGEPLNVAIIQPSIEQDRKWDPSYQRVVMQTIESLTEKAASSADLVIWPETALPFYYARDVRNTERLMYFINSISTELVTGAITVKVDNEKQKVKLANSAILFDTHGKQTGSYDKVHLVPFGEYVPFGNSILSFVDKMVTGIGDYTPGKSTALLRTSKGKFATLICYEAAFPGLVRSFFKKDGDFIVILTNDGWFGRTTGPFQNFTLSAFRAIENRKPVLRAANTGISGIFDSRGRLMNSTKLFERTAIIHTVNTDKSRSFYSRFGDLFIYFCTIITIIVMADIRRK